MTSGNRMSSEASRDGRTSCAIRCVSSFRMTNEEGSIVLGGYAGYLGRDAEYALPIERNGNESRAQGVMIIGHLASFSAFRFYSQTAASLRCWKHL